MNVSKTKLADIVNNGKNDFNCYIFDFIENKASIYLPEYKLSITTKIIEKTRLF